MIRAFEHLGAVLFLGSAVSTVMLLGFGGVVHSWDSGQMIGLYVATAVLWILFALQQKFHIFTSERIFPVQFFKDPLVVGLWIWTIVGNWISPRCNDIITCLLQAEKGLQHTSLLA